MLEDKDLVKQVENLLISAKQQRFYYKMNPKKEYLQLYFLKLRESLEIIVQERLSRETRDPDRREDAGEAEPPLGEHLHGALVEGVHDDDDRARGLLEAVFV